MIMERIRAEPAGGPFPVYDDLATRLLRAHAPGTADSDQWDPTVAHTLACCAGYAYGDARTVADVMARLGLEGNACVFIQQTVDAMYIFSTAVLVQSACGRIVILSYRGTEVSNLGNWLGDADIAPERALSNGSSLHAHAGFYRNVRATRATVLQELRRAAAGKSLLDPDRSVEHSMEALYITGHSLGGAMALLFAELLAACADDHAVISHLRAVYTFGQPMALLHPVPLLARDVGQKVFRHVIARDVVPALPPAGWGQFIHVGHEYHFDDGAWHAAAEPTTQLRNMREVPRSLIALVAPATRRATVRYSMAEHAPHQYIARLRPRGRVTEFGDFE